MHAIGKNTLYSKNVHMEIGMKIDIGIHSKEKQSYCISLTFSILELIRFYPYESLSIKIQILDWR